ncbi:MAG TPA: rhodanese-like domain-containing protein [Candidatus Binataceae bacterium]|nr:rhodanese-like domain-containing protein [Candidatus Binataceae bacterium]
MPEIVEIEAMELKQRLERGDPLLILDVREPEEVAVAAFPGALNVPMGDVPSRLAELDPEAEWVIVCHHGMRSANVAMYLIRNGFEKIANLSGGIDEWSLTVDPATPRY